MADNQRTEDLSGPAAARGAAKTWILIGILSFLLLIGGGFAGALLLYPEQVGGMLGLQAEGEEAEKQRPAIYYPLEEPFIVNLANDSRRLLQVNVELMTRDPESVVSLERHTPVIRNNLLLLFSSKTVDDLSTRSGKETLRDDALEEVRSILDEYGETAEIEEVYFTSLVIQ